MSDVLAVTSGFLVGVVSGLIGIGGGVLLVPIMVIGFKFEQHLAQGTSLAAILPTSIVGALTHSRSGNVALKQALIMGVAGALVVIFGATLALWLHGEVLARLFGAFLLFSAYRLWPRRKRVPQTPVDETGAQT